MKSQQGYKNPTPRQFSNDLLAVKSFERGEGRVHHKPIEVYLQVASACNLDCYMCYEHLRPPKFRRGRGLRSMPPEMFAKIERDILPHSTKITFGVGGEPMLCEHLLDYIQRSYAARQHVHLMTNGTRITSDAVAEVMARCLTSMEISIDAATKETYERIRLGSKWEHIQANLERLNRFRFQSEPKERTHLSLCFVMMKSNVHELPLFVDFAKKMRADRISGWHVIPVTDEGRREALIDDQERSDHYLALAKARAAELGIEADLVKPFKKDGAAFVPALAGTRQAAIERMARLDDDETIAKAIAAVAPSAEDVAIGHDSPALPELHAGISPAATLPRETIEAAAGAPPSNGGNGGSGSNGGPDGNGHEHHDHGATPVDANGVLAPIDFVDFPDTPDAAAAAIALQDFLARPKGARLHCASPYTGVFIFYDGRVFPCCHPHAHTKLPMGNLLKQEFDEIWNGRAYRNLRAGLKLGDPPPICQRCSIVHGPSENMEQAGPDEGEGADLASYYGALDLDPRDPREEDELLARIGVAGAAERLRAGSPPRETAAEHVQSVERELVPLREHTQAVEESLIKLHRHAEDLQSERDALVGHARNLEGELRPLREHSKTIEEILLKLHRHAADVEHERDALVGHARNLESEVRPLREHTKTVDEMLRKLKRHSSDLEHERDALVGHVRNIEAEREAMFGHIKNLEHILRKGYGMALYRLRCKIGVMLGIGQKPKPKS